MNEQAANLQQMIRRLRPTESLPTCSPESRPAIRWLLHSCKSEIDLAYLAKDLEDVLAEFGYESLGQTVLRWQRSLYDVGFSGELPRNLAASSATENPENTERMSFPRQTTIGISYATIAEQPRPKAFVAYTESAEIETSRLAGTTAVIFVLDTTPASLINTYSQIKSLVRQRRDFASHLGLLYVDSVENRRRQLLLSCERFLQIMPTDLGTILQSNAGPLSGQQERTGGTQSARLAGLRAIVRRGLCRL